jgi:hypothetical protein
MSPSDSVNESDFSAPWWEEKAATKIHPKIVRLFRYYADHDKDRLQAYSAYSALYTNRDITGNDYLKSYRAAFTQEEYSRAPLNVCKVMIDAVHSRLTRPAIAVEFLPAGANWSLRKRSRQMGQFVRQQMHACDLRDKEDQAELDALVYGLGAVKTAPHPVVPEIENFRVLAKDIFVDPTEAAANGKPTHLYHRMYVDRGRLAKLFPKAKKAIKQSKDIGPREVSDWSDGNEQTNALMQGNMVEVVEAYKLPSWQGAGDGRKVIFVDQGILDECEWKATDFPFSFTYWKKDPTVGFFGISLAEELIGLHYDVNTSILHTEKCIEAMPKPYILCPADGEVTEGKLANVPGVIINHTGRAPQIVMPPSVPADVVQYIETQWRRALQVSRLVAMGLPESAGSQGETGQAFKDIVDIQSTELSPAFKFREDFCVRVAEQQLVAGKILDEREKEAGNGGFKTVLRKDRNTVEAVEWGLFDLDPKKDSYVVQAEPTSALSTTFGGRLAEMKELIGLQIIPASRAFKYLDIPDFDAEARIQNASLDFIERVMEEILDDGKYTEPEPTMDLRLALKVCQKSINLAQAMSVPEDRVNLLYQFLRGVTDLIAEEQEATQMQASGMGPGLPGQPPAMDITGAAPGAATLSGTVMGQ